MLTGTKQLTNLTPLWQLRLLILTSFSYALIFVVINEAGPLSEGNGCLWVWFQPFWAVTCNLLWFPITCGWACGGAIWLRGISSLGGLKTPQRSFEEHSWPLFLRGDRQGSGKGWVTGAERDPPPTHTNQRECNNSSQKTMADQLALLPPLHNPKGSGGSEERPPGGEGAVQEEPRGTGEPESSPPPQSVDNTQRGPPCL